MTDWTDAYAAAEDPNRQYELLRAEMARLRGRRDEDAFFDEAAVERDVRRLNETVEGDLIVFLANDFGVPRAYRPSGLDLEVQDDVRRAVLERKYDDAQSDLNEIRRELLDDYPGVHKAIVAAATAERIRYYLPEGSQESTNFLTVREMVGLIDYTTNSAQRDGLSITY